MTDGDRAAFAAFLAAERLRLASVPVIADWTPMAGGRDVREQEEFEIDMGDPYRRYMDANVGSLRGVAP